jgi:hypothetical protein
LQSQPSGAPVEQNLDRQVLLIASRGQEDVAARHRKRLSYRLRQRLEELPSQLFNGLGSGARPDALVSRMDSSMICDNRKADSDHPIGAGAIAVSRLGPITKKTAPVTKADSEEANKRLTAAIKPRVYGRIESTALEIRSPSCR